MNTKSTDPAVLVEQMRDILAKARSIAETAKTEGRAMTAEEGDQLAAYLAEGENLKTRIASAKATQRVRNGDAAVRAAINGLSDGVASKTLPAWATKGARTDRREWAEKAATVLRGATETDGRKSVVQGSYEVPSLISSSVDRLPEFPRNLMDLLVTRVPLQGTTGKTFSYLVQTVRDSNAAPVPDGQTKPVSNFDYDDREGKISVVAHLSAPLPLRFLSDYAELEQLLNDEMFAGVERALEEQIVNGDGPTGDAFVGLMNTSGVLAQTWDTDLLTTARKAATALEITGQVPNAWGVHPADVEQIDLLQDAQRRFYYRGPGEQFDGDPLWSLPVVKSLAIPQGTAVLADWQHLKLIVREDARLDIDQSGELFRTNRFQLRCEGRYGLAVTRPGAFCMVALTEPDPVG